MLVCDSHCESRQIGVIRVPFFDPIECMAETGSFTIVAATSSSTASDLLTFGQPVHLLHVASSRYLCAGAAEETERAAVRSVPAEISRENGRLTLLPPFLAKARGGDAFEPRRGLPPEDSLAACTFRFLPTRNHGRGAIFTDDPVYMASESMRLVRAGLQPLPATSSAEASADAANDAAEAILTRTISVFDDDEVFGYAAGRATLRPPAATNAVVEPLVRTEKEFESTPFDE